MSQNSPIRCCIWGLDSDLTLEEVRNLQLNIDYSEPIEYLIEREDLELDEYDKRLMHRWEFLSDINFHQLPDSQDVIRYYVAKGIFEFARSENNAFLDQEKRRLLPRDMRVTDKEAYVIFAEMAGRVYAIVYGSSSAFQVRTILMGRGLKHRRRPQWKDIDEKLPQYSMDSDFFYWIYHRYSQNPVVHTQYGDIEVRDVEGIGRFSDRQQHYTRAKGPNSTNELSNKTALGIDQLVSESDFVLHYRNLDLTVCIGEYSFCTIDPKRTIVVDDEGNIEGLIGNESFVLLTLYLEIIPGLISAYHADGNWTPAVSRSTKRQWALDVIEELCMHHGITKTDLNQLPIGS